MPLSEQEHVAALNAIQSAAYDGGQWNSALDFLARASGGWAGQLLGVSPKGVQFNFISEFSGEIAREFELRGGADPAINPRTRIFSQKPNQVLTDVGLVKPGEIAKSAFFHDFLYKVDSADICLARLPDLGSTAICAGVSHSFRQEAFQREQLDSFTTYLDPICRAVGFAAALEERGAALVAGAFSLVEYAAILIDAAGAISSLTPRAEAMLQTRQHIWSRNRCLYATDGASDVTLQNAVRLACVKPGSLLVSQVSKIPLFSTDGAPVMAHVAPLPTEETVLRFGPVAVVIIKAPGRAAAPKLLQRIYGLSASEAAIAISIGDGLTLGEIAAHRQVSAATVRAQLKLIFQKTGLHRQADLMRSLSSIFDLGAA